MLNRTYDKTLWWLPGLLALGALLFSYRSTIELLAHQWLNNQDYSHGILIVPIAAYLIWERRGDLKRVEVRSDWRALPLLFVCIGVFIVGELGAELFTIRVSMLLFIIALTWLLYGPEVFKILRFPLVFLFLMLPLPGFIYRNITFPLQLSASIGAVNLLHTLGISAYREGNVIDIGFMQLQVVEACNGLRYILPLLTLGVLFAYFGQKVLWKRIFLVAATIPIAIAANVFRVAGTGWIGMYWGNEAAEGFFHSFSGWAVFMLCMFLFLLLSLLLRALPGRGRPREEKPDDGADPGPWRGPQWAALLAALLIVGPAPLVVDSLGNVAQMPLKRSVGDFPTDFLGWQGQKTEMDPEIWDQVGAQDYVIINYAKDNQGPLNFYVAYYEYQRKAGDFVHSPRLCLPGAGWYIESNKVRVLHEDGGGAVPTSLKLNELIIQKGPSRQLVFFWYQGRGRNFTSEFAAKFYMVWDGIWRRRTDGALVRVIMPVGRGQDLADIRRIMDPFALAVSRELEDYLP